MLLLRGLTFIGSICPPTIVRIQVSSLIRSPFSPRLRCRATLQHDDSEKSTSSTSLEDNVASLAGGASAVSDDAFLASPPATLMSTNSSEEIVAAMRQSMCFIPRDKER